MIRLSVILNIIFIILWLLNWFNSPSYTLGRLNKNIKIGHFTGDSVIFTLPKGLAVRNISERGFRAIDQFENERFEIVITSDKNLVNYNIPKDSLNTYGNFYSADIKKY